MPKKNKDGRKGGGGRSRMENTSEDDASVFNDDESVISMAGSEVSAAPQDEHMEDVSAEETYENKFKDAIDLAMEKSASNKIKGMDALCQGMMKRYVPDFLDNQKVTISDIVEKSLKKGTAQEVKAAAKLSLLLGLQLIEPEDVYQSLRGTMVQIISDKTLSPVSRAAVVSGLSGLCFIAGGELAEVLSVMKLLQSVFSASSPKQDGSVATHSPEVLNLHTVCLSGWALLSTLLTPGQIYETVNSVIVILRGLLKSPDVDLRITAGETIALVLEAAYGHDEDFEPEEFEELVGELKQLATDCSKSKSKKDRKEQRSSFRDVLRGVEEGEQPSETIKFGKEVLKLDSWSRKCQYDWFCKIIGAGINFHLGVNSMIREIFELGPTINLLDVNTHALTKSQRNAANQQAFKLRTQQRSKNRDKRSAVV